MNRKFPIDRSKVCKKYPTILKFKGLSFFDQSLLEGERVQCVKNLVFQFTNKDRLESFSDKDKEVSDNEVQIHTWYFFV